MPHFLNESDEDISMFKATLMISIFSMMMIFCSFAGELQTVNGRLIDDLKMVGNIKKMIVTDRERTIKLANDYIETASCVDGEFKIKKIGSGHFELREVVRCNKWVDETADVYACPKIFSPVCGVPVVQECEDDFMCEKSMPRSVTFGNNCEMYAARAVFLHEGECEEGSL